MTISLFFDKESYEEAVKYHRKPPCWDCLVRVRCFEMIFDNEYQDYQVIMYQPCDKGYKWMCIIDDLVSFIDL